MGDGTAFRISILRPQDLLVLDLDLYNLRPSADGARLERRAATAPAFVVVNFPPQALGEEVFPTRVVATPEGNVSERNDVSGPPIRSVLADRSRLVFRLPDRDLPPLTVSGLIDWRNWQPVLAPTALPRGTVTDAGIPPPSFPSDMQTALEFPWRVLLSPDASGRWLTDSGATGSTNYQLWTAVLRGAAGADVPDVRAIASVPGPLPMRTPVDCALVANPREEIVQLSSNFHLPVPGQDGAPATFTPVPLAANRLELTALGANVDLNASWDYPLVAAEHRPDGYVPLGVSQYHHTAALGRDHFVQVQTVGYLCGTGHRAAITTKVERLPAGLEAVRQPPGGATLYGGKAYLLETAELTILEHTVDYGKLGPAFAYARKEFPFEKIELPTKSAIKILTPWASEPLADETAFEAIPLSVEIRPLPFWLRDPTGGKLLLDAIGTAKAADPDATGTDKATDPTSPDNAGQPPPVNFQLPLMFVPYELITEHAAIRHVFDHPPFNDANVLDLANQTLPFAPPEDRSVENRRDQASTRLPTGKLVYDIEQPQPDPPTPAVPAMNPARAPASYVPRFLPRVATAWAAIPAVDNLLGSSGQHEMQLDPTYLLEGFDPTTAPESSRKNRAQTFLRFVQPLPLALPAQRGGGVAAPHLVAHALSRHLGPVHDPDQLNAGTAGTVSKGTFEQMKLLGTIAVSALLAPAAYTFSAPGVEQPEAAPTQKDLDRVDYRLNPPRLTTGRVPGRDGVESRFVWKPPLGMAPLGPLTLDMTGKDCDLLLDATNRVVHGEAPTTVVSGRMRNAVLSFASVAKVTLGQLTFHTENGKRTDVGARDVKIEFTGPLEFVNTLRTILPEDGFDDPPFLTVDAQGVVAGYTLGVPSVGVGVFSIQNLAVRAMLSIPFTDRPAGLRFAIAERHKPFLVTVSLFGGGGFFGLAVSAKGVEAVEASLEFGGNISLNLLVASGGVLVMAGIYYGMASDSVKLGGFLRCGGCLQVLGLIGLSLEFHLGLNYEKPEGGGSQVSGEATLTVSVKLVLVSIPVELSVRKQFGGSGDPSFADSFSPAQWMSYLQAFA